MKKHIVLFTLLVMTPLCAFGGFLTHSAPVPSAPVMAPEVAGPVVAQTSMMSSILPTLGECAKMTAVCAKSVGSCCGSIAKGTVNVGCAVGRGLTGLCEEHPAVAAACIAAGIAYVGYQRYTTYCNNQDAKLVEEALNSVVDSVSNFDQFVLGVAGNGRSFSTQIIFSQGLEVTKKNVYRGLFPHEWMVGRMYRAIIPQGVPGLSWFFDLSGQTIAYKNNVEQFFAAINNAMTLQGQNLVAARELIRAQGNSLVEKLLRRFMELSPELCANWMFSDRAARANVAGALFRIANPGQQGVNPVGGAQFVNNINLLR